MSEAEMRNKEKKTRETNQRKFLALITQSNGKCSRIWTGIQLSASITQFRTNLNCRTAGLTRNAREALGREHDERLRERLC